jgi:high-affinity iron transporter
VALHSALLTLLLALPAGPADAAAPPSDVRGVVKLTGAKTVAGAVVSLHAPGLKLVPPEEPVRIDQKGFRLVPRVVAIQAGTTVRFANEDPEPQNVYSPEGHYNLGAWPPGGAREFVFRIAGVYSQRSGLHPDVRGFVVVLDTPYYAVSDETGHFEVRGVPAGKYRLEVWHEEMAGLAREVTVEPDEPLKLELVVE